MKIQCGCGAKYAFEVTPEQAQQPVTFVCPACGLDSSAYVTQLVRQQFGLAGDAPVVAAAPAAEFAPPPGQVAAPVPVQTYAPPPAPVAVAVRLHRSEPKPPDDAAPVVDTRFCPKHPRVRTTETCLVCNKPICPKCMELFGYLCSPLCKQKADLQGLEIPVFAGQKSVVEARKWRKVGLIAGSVAAVIVIFFGVWFWYAWFGSTPGVAFAVRFEEPAYSGASALYGEDQIVFLHGGELARHDLKQKKAIWSVQLVDKKVIEKQVAETIKAAHEAQKRLDNEYPDADPIRLPSPEKMAKAAEKAAARDLDLRVVGQNIWVASSEKLVRYDWETGKPAQEIALTNHFGGMIARGGELLLLDEQPGKEIVTHINLTNGQTRAEEILLATKRAAEVAAKPGETNAAAKPTLATTGARSTKPTSGRGLPVGGPDQGGNKPLDPKRVEKQVAQLPLPEKLALPAVLSVNRGQERIMEELKGSRRGKPGVTDEAEELENHFMLIPAKEGYVQFSSRVIEHRMTGRQAMKAPPKKSALDGAVSVTATAEVANEILNEMQRDRGGDTELVDESRYQVIVRRADGSGTTWTGEVVGPPALFPLQSVNVVTANQKIIVLDKNNQKLWESPLAYSVVSDAREGDPETTGQGPCVERGNLLLVFDQGVLAAFDLKTGNAQWRVPSVGISGLFFDEQGMLYVNSTTAGPDSIKYSRQIDVNAQTRDLVLKIDPRSGKTLWSTETRGEISYLSGKFIYVLESYKPFDDDDDDGDSHMQIGLETKPYLRIRRLNPSNGKELWEHIQERAPLAVRFEQNRIHLVFKKEVQVLKFLSL